MNTKYRGGNGTGRRAQSGESLPSIWPWFIALVLLGIVAGFIAGRLPSLSRPPAGWVPLHHPQATSWDYAGYVEYEGVTVEHVATWYADALETEANVSTQCETGDECFTVLGYVGNRQVQVQGSAFASLQTVLVHVGSLGGE